MKFLSVLVITALMIWTWSMINSEPAVSLETHAGIQSRLAGLIAETIKGKKPASSEVLIDNMWTETLDSTPGKTQVKAHFVYHYSESIDNAPVTSQISGEALLDLQPADSSGLEHWSMSGLKTTNDQVVFGQPMIITTGEGEATPAPPAEEHH